MTDTSSNQIWQAWQNYRDFELRAHRFRPEMLPLFYQYLGIRPDSNVLDGGCGTGVFTRFLAQGLTDGRITGFDINPGFIAYGCARNKEMALENRVTLELADGFQLPYPDHTFDAVTNYTYLGVLSDPPAGLRELIRVGKPGAVISCVVATNQVQAVHWLGDYPFAGADELQRLLAQEGKIFTQFAHAGADLRQSNEWHAFRYPKLFDQCGLQDINLYPFAHAICYSDSRFPADYRRELAIAETRSDSEWIRSRYQAKRDIYNQHQFSDQDCDRLIELLDRKAMYLAEHFDQDRSYEWHGAFNFIVSGVKRASYQV